jgi:hypothetical protein
MNILVNPASINVSPWNASGTGVTTPSATTLQTGAGASSLAQTISVTPAQTYQCQVTVQGSAAAGNVFCTLYATDYSTNYGSASVGLTTSAQLLAWSSSIPAGVTSVIFELDFSSTASAIETITGAAVFSPLSLGNLMLLGCGS